MAESEILWVIENSSLTHAYLAETVGETISEPYPALLWRVSNNRIHHEILPEIPEKTMSFPFPSLMWKIENGILTHGLLPECICLGAFENAGKLQKIVIPESVKKIGNKSFSGTALKSVKIASDCEYSESSFPENCGMEFYE